MKSVDQLEQNTIYSFSYVKKDVTEMYDLLRNVRREVRALKLENQFLKDELRRLDLKTQIPMEVEQGKATYVVSTEGEKVHDSSCMFAKKIKRSNRETYDTLSNAIKLGYKKCICLK